MVLICIDMAKQTINIGTVANDNTGDPIRDAFDKVNDNFTELYDSKAPLASPTFTGDATITSIILPSNGQTKFTAPTSDGHATGPVNSDFACGYTSSAIGDGVYLDVNSKWQKWDKGTSEATYGGMLAIALEVKATDAILKVALPGSFVYCTAFPALTVGSKVWMDDAGAIVVTKPDTASHVNRVIGWAVHADKIFFMPSQDYQMI